MVEKELLDFFPSRLCSVRVGARISTPVDRQAAKYGRPRNAYEGAIGRLEHVAGPLVDDMLHKILQKYIVDYFFILKMYYH